MISAARQEVRDACTTAICASWRVVLLSSAVVGLPGLAVGLLLASVGLRWMDPLQVALSAVVFGCSFFLHELAHCVIYVTLGGESAHLAADGGWVSCGIIREGLGYENDGLVAVAGPAAGVSVGVFLLMVPGADAAVAIPFSLTHAVHAVSLMPATSDGRQIWESLRIACNRREG